MSRVLTYINDNSLPCKTWLSAKNPSNFSISGDTFRWINSIGNSEYDFIQSNSSLHPTYTINGVSFSGEHKLFPVNTDIFTGVSSYSLIFITTGSLTSRNTLLNVSKVSPTKPSWMEEYYTESEISQQFSLVNVANTVGHEYTDVDTNYFATSRDIKYGITKLKIGSEGFIAYVNSDKGTVINNYPGHFFLGNSADSSHPFQGNLIDFLIFTPAISDVDIENLIVLLLADILSWNDLTVSDWEGIGVEWDEVE